MFQNLRNLRRNKKRVLGLNERYLSYIRPNNFQSAIQIADDKVLTKKILEDNDIPTPKLLKLISDRREVDELNFDELPKSFVIKPAQGSKGGGIEIYYNRDSEGRWIRADKSKASEGYLKNHMYDIIDGRFSMNQENDVVMIEERVKPHKAFRYHTFKGTPDVRVIVYNNIPVMAMLRLPTEKSKGKANLDQGAIGVGIDMAAGKTTHGVSGKSGFIERIPHTKLSIPGLRVPYWTRILEYSLQASQVSGLGYIGVDLLIDREEGPKIVELNARPGLSIQFANKDGLRRRLRKAGGIDVKSQDQGIRLAKDLFGGEIEDSIELITGKNVIGIYETISIFNIENGKSKTVRAKIDTGADSTSIDIKLAQELGYSELIEEFSKIDFDPEMDKNQRREFEAELNNKYKEKWEQLEEIQFVRSSHGLSLRPYVKIDLDIDGTRFETRASIYDRSKLTYSIIVGRKSLYKFLVDPSKK